jgi:hypothetical protein
LFDARLTAAPPDPAACARLTVQVELAGAVNVDGLQESAFIAGRATTVMVAVTEAPSLAAVSVAL